VDLRILVYEAAADSGASDGVGCKWTCEYWHTRLLLMLARLGM